MAVRLFLDENLSERLLRSLNDLFPNSTHARALGLGGAADALIWERARAEGFVLVTRDEDFIGISVLRGAPPKVVWLDVGNARSAAIAELLRARAEDIERFVAHEEYAFLAIGPEKAGSTAGPTSAQAESGCSSAATPPDSE